MSVSTVTKPLTTPALCDLMFSHIQRINPTSVIILVVEKPSITLALSGNSKQYSCDNNEEQAWVQVFQQASYVGQH